MKKKVKIKFLDDELKEFEVKVRDKDLIEINNLYHSQVYRNKKKYTRKNKHKNCIIE